MYDGVGKSGSPAPKPMTGRPAALRALAFASTARVADSAMEPIRAEIREVVMSPSFHPGDRCRTLVPPRESGSAGSTRPGATPYTRPLVVLTPACHAHAPGVPARS